MRRLVLRPAARNDLNKIYHFLAERSGSSERAHGYIRRLRSSLETLRTFPESGRLRDDLRKGLRVFGFERRVVVTYIIQPDGDVEIGRVFYGGQDYEALLGEQEEP